MPIDRQYREGDQTWMPKIGWFILSTANRADDLQDFDLNSQILVTSAI